MITRRTFIRNAALGTAGAMLPQTVWANTSMTIGTMQIDTLSDGNLTLPPAMTFGDLPAADLAPILQEFGIDPDATLTPDCNVTLIRDGTRSILIDVGAGPDFMSSAGKLADALDAIGVSADDITHVVFTHAHPDHLWGLVDDFDDPVFPNATYMIGKTEWDYWIDPKTVDTIDSGRTTFAVGAKRRLDTLEDNITFFNDGEEILPNIAARATFGHTPGHMAFHVGAGTDSVMVLGDSIVNHHVAFARPDWVSGSDQDGEMGIKTRTLLLDQLSSEQMHLIGFHLPYPGIGRAEKKETAMFLSQRKLTLALILAGTTLHASEDIADQYPQSALYAKPVEFIPGVFSATGATAPPTYENSGHNNNLNFIITGEGVVVINGGGAYILAKALHDEIKVQTDEPVVLVINENGQGHAMLGNSYWAEQGVPIVAHVDAAHEFEERGFSILESMQRVNLEKAEGTFLQGPTETFDDAYTITLGDFQIEARYVGPTHTVGDIIVWLPNQSLLISGDAAFHERMLPLFPETDTLAWIDTWDNAIEPLNATYVIPGHGHPTNMDQVRRYTKDYLVYLRAQIGALLDEGGSLAEAYYVDQTPYLLLDTFDELATKNAGRVFEAMEFE